MDKKKWSVAVAAAACVLMTTMSVGAATLYLNSQDTAVETTESTEETGTQTNDYVTYIESGAWKKDIADYELVATSEALTKSENGTYEYSYSYETENTSSQMMVYIDEEAFVGNIAIHNVELQFEPSDGDETVSLIAVAEKNEDNTATIKIYKK